MLFIILFARELLGTKKAFPFLDKILLFLAFSLLFLTTIVLIFGIPTIIYVNLLANFIFPFLLYVGFKSYFNKNKIAIFFITAEIVFLISSTVYSLMMQGILP